MLREKGRSRAPLDLGSHSALCLLRGAVVRGLLAILGLKKLTEYIFIAGNEKKKPIGIVMQIIGCRLDKKPLAGLDGRTHIDSKQCFPCVASESL